MRPYNLPERQPDLVPDFVRALPEDGAGRLAIFDADGTLWRDDAADDFTRWMIDEGHAPAGHLWDEYLRIYREDHAAGCRYLLRVFTGLPMARYHELNAQWWRDVANRRWIAEVVEALYLLADRGYTIWIVTGSPTDTMSALPTFLPIDRLVGMDFALDAQGVITGDVDGISCADEGKAEKVLHLWGDAPLPFAAGNGSLDAWMMELATDVAWSVYPNEKFAAESARRGWPILHRPADFVEEAKLA